jgi:hypothetical protein
MLRSVNDLRGFGIRAMDGETGEVVGRRVLISPRQVETVSWLEAKVFVDMSRQAVKRAPLSDSEPNFASSSKDR